MCYMGRTWQELQEVAIIGKLGVSWLLASIIVGDEKPDEGFSNASSYYYRVAVQERSWKNEAGQHDTDITQ